MQTTKAYRKESSVRGKGSAPGCVPKLLLGNADQLLRVLNLIVAALAGLVQGVHDFTAVVRVCCGAAVMLEWATRSLLQ